MIQDFPSHEDILLGQARLEYNLNQFKNGGKGAFHPALVQGLTRGQFAELAMCLMNSQVWGKNEEPDTSAMFGSYRRYDENPRWNIGFMGSIWMDVNLCGEDHRIAFYHRSDTEGMFTSDELMSRISMFEPIRNSTSSKLRRSGNSNFTPKKKKRK